jgi:hypothetical protein
MRFPAFWSRAKSGPAAAWGWSDTSPEEARAAAADRAAQIAAGIRAGQRPPRHAGYYPDRPFREPVIRELADASGEVAALVSRNAYGAEILNTSDALFADIDLPPPPRPGFLARLLGAREPARGGTSPAEDAALARAAQWVSAHPGWSWRVYRTAGGLRLLAGHATFDPADPVVAQAFEQLAVDPLYRRLCSAQHCFRARLTPKPWRMGIQSIPPRWPWAGAAEERAFIAWDRAYRAAAARHATCELVTVVGSRDVHPRLRDVVGLHDAACRVGSGLPLA